MSWQEKFWDSIIEYNIDSDEDENSDTQSISSIVMPDNTNEPHVQIESRSSFVSDGDKIQTTENILNSKKTRSSHTTWHQFQKLSTFMVGRPKFPKGNTKPNEETQKLLQDFEVFIQELNDIGPPFHNSKEWRRVWNNLMLRRKHEETNTNATLQGCIQPVVVSGEESCSSQSVAAEDVDHGTQSYKDTLRDTIAEVGIVMEKLKNIKDNLVVLKALGLHEN